MFQQDNNDSRTLIFIGESIEAWENWNLLECKFDC